MTNRWASLIVSVLFVSVLRGDIAPTQYNGYTFTTQVNSDIRMKSEEVDIYWGRPEGEPNVPTYARKTSIRVVGKFEMVNETDKPIPLTVGFPISLGHLDGVRDFHVGINDINNRQPVRDIPLKEVYGIVVRKWYGWDQTFPPGRTIVWVEYHLRTYVEKAGSGAYENLRYILDTGAMWKGTIGQADIRVHFGGPLAAEQVREWTWPQNWRIDGNELCWRFTDFEPELKDNIFIEYMPRDIYDKIERLRKAIRDNPQDEARVVEFARRCFRLAEGPDMVVWDSDSINSRLQDPNHPQIERFSDALAEATAPRGGEASLGKDSPHGTRTPPHSELVGAMQA